MGIAVDLHCGDCLKVLPTLEANSADSFVTDPPYGLSFMGKDWDHGVPGVTFWEAALRVAKPGAHLLAFGGTRTFHRLMCAIEDAGWEIRDTIMWIYGSGFPKSLDVSKALDKAAGAERVIIGEYKRPDGKSRNYESWEHDAGYGGGWNVQYRAQSASATDAAREWAGWGTALKPAWEPVIVARKPLDGTVAANVLAWGCGGINVDGCRVTSNELIAAHHGTNGASGHTMGSRKEYVPGSAGMVFSANGRWPANVVHDGSDEVVGVFPDTGAGAFPKRQHVASQVYGQIQPKEIPERICMDTGSAARFFYCAKASKADRDEGCGGLAIRQTTGGGGMNDPNGDDVCGKYGSVKSPSRNHHPTVKPTALMRWLVRLVTPPGGVVLDPFMGSGSTGKAAVLEGFDFVGIDRELEYVEIARRRIAIAQPALAL